MILHIIHSATASVNHLEKQLVPDLEIPAPILEEQHRHPQQLECNPYSSFAHYMMPTLVLATDALMNFLLRLSIIFYFCSTGSLWITSINEACSLWSQVVTVIKWGDMIALLNEPPSGVKQTWWGVKAGPRLRGPGVGNMGEISRGLLQLLCSQS